MNNQMCETPGVCMPAEHFQQSILMTFVIKTAVLHPSFTEPLHFVLLLNESFIEIIPYLDNV